MTDRIIGTNNLHNSAHRRVLDRPRHAFVPSRGERDAVGEPADAACHVHALQAIAATMAVAMARDEHACFAGSATMSACEFPIDRSVPNDPGSFHGHPFDLDDGLHPVDGRIDPNEQIEDGRRDRVARVVAEALGLAVRIRTIGAERLIRGSSADWDMPARLDVVHQRLLGLADAGDPTAWVVAAHLDPLVAHLHALALDDAFNGDDTDRMSNDGAGS